jgi:cytidylate kinase
MSHSTANFDGLVIALDGPSGSGKSSTARGVARGLGLRYLDTGALYRALTWAILERGLDVEDADAVAGECEQPKISISTDPGDVVVDVDGTDVTALIREPRVAQSVSAVSRVPKVRDRLVALQRELIGSGGVVVEGRDIGTVVAPDAGVKIYLIADPAVRAARRAGELGRELNDQNVAATQEAMARRDHLDSTRTVSPLAKADDAIEVDTSNYTLDEVIALVIRAAESSIGESP